MIVSNQTLKRALTRYGTEKTAAWDEKVHEVDLNRKLTIQLQDLQKQQDALLQEMNLLRTHATQVSTMNPQEYTRLQEESVELKAALHEQIAKYQTKSAEYAQLLHLYESSTEERKKMHEEKEIYERMKHNSTPRPQWNRVRKEKHRHKAKGWCNVTRHLAHL